MYDPPHAPSILCHATCLMQELRRTQTTQQAPAEHKEREDEGLSGRLFVSTQSIQDWDKARVAPEHNPSLESNPGASATPFS